LSGLAGIYGATGDPQRAATLFGAAAALHEAIGTRVEASLQQRYERRLAAVRAEIDAAAFTTARETGRTLSPKQALGVAIASIGTLG